MRTKLITTSCLLAVFFLVIALRGPWARATAEDGTHFDVSLYGVSHELYPNAPRLASKRCSYLTGKGAVELCAPTNQSEAPFSMLCAVLPLLVAGLVLAFASGIVTYVSPFRAKGTAAALAAAALAAAFTGTVVAQIAMPRALKAFDELPLYLGGLSFTAVWFAMGLLLFAAALSTTSTMLGHS
jgi:hypothetical protein